ncbi:MAG: LegC family aminotransferase [Desulfobulbaceae bacterium]|nr:LegC family aminotransferase [Desulfobulbaceae bacterium]
MGYDDLIKFIRDLYGIPEGDIPLHAPVLKGKEKEYLLNCIDTGYVSSVGAFVERFERMVGSRIGAADAVAVVNGTSALHVALRAVGVDRGDLVITQALSFVATANAVMYCGAEPVFLDVEQGSMGLDPAALALFLEQATYINNGRCCHIQSGKRIAACVPMHTFGHPCAIERIVEICTAYDIPVVEDAAEALGSEMVGASGHRSCGLFGRAGIFSFNGNKIVTSGGGGMVVTTDEALGAKIRHLTTTAKKPHPYLYEHTELGYNYRMPNINAAVGCAQFERLDDFLTQKRELANRYHDFFKGSSIHPVCEPVGTRSNYWLNTIITADRKERDALIEATNQAGIYTRPVWTPLNRLPMYEHAVTDSLERTTYFADRLVNLPSSVKA